MVEEFYCMVESAYLNICQVDGLDFVEDKNVHLCWSRDLLVYTEQYLHHIPRLVTH